jgi:small subunit ribosomal protein S20
MRVSKKQNAYNRAVKSSLKTAHKKFLAAPAEEAEAAYRKASSELDLAARKGVIPKQRADRKKSRLAKVLLKKSS